MDHSSDGGAELAARVGEQVGRQRSLQRMTATQLAEKSGLSRTIVAKIESGEGNPSLGTLWRIARALRVPLGVLIGEHHAPRPRVVRADAGDAIEDPSGMVGRLLHADDKERRSEVFSIELPPGTLRESPAHLRGVEEVVVVTQGRALVGPALRPDRLDADSGPETLRRGDAIWFAADVPHHYETLGATACRLLCWMLYPPSAA